MKVEVNVQPSAIEQQVIQSIVDTALGARIKTEVEKFLNDGSSWGSDSLAKRIGAALDAFIKAELQKWIVQEYGELVREKVRASVTEQMVSEATTRMLEKLWKMRDE